MVDIQTDINAHLFIDLLLKFEKSNNSGEVEDDFCHFMQTFGFEAKLHNSENQIHVTLTSDDVAISLFWFPRELHYCPIVAELSDETLTGLSLDNYASIWLAFNACCYQLWQLPDLYKRILGELCKGKSLKEIANSVDLSLPSVKRYISLIRALLGAKTNPQAIAIALRQGWI